MTRLNPGDIRRINPHGEVKPLLDSQEYYESSSGPGARMKYLVKDIKGPPEVTLAVAATASGIPRVGDLYFGVHGPAVSRVSAALMEKSKTQAIVTVVWGALGSLGGPIEPPVVDAEATIEVVSTIQAGTTKYAHDGTALVVEQELEIFLGNPGEEDPADTAFETYTEWKEVEIQRPMHIVRFHGLRSQSPGDVSSRYVGHTNATPIFPNDQGVYDPPGMWLCTQLDGTSNDNGQTWNTTWEFQRAPVIHPRTPAGIPLLPEGSPEPQLGWGAVYHLEEPFQRGEVVNPLGLVGGEGIKVAQIYPRVDFRRLAGLNFGPAPP